MNIRKLLFIASSFLILAICWSIMVNDSYKWEYHIWGNYGQRSILPIEIYISVIFLLLFISLFFIDFDEPENENAKIKGE